MSRMWEIWHVFYLQAKHPLSEAQQTVSRHPGSTELAFLWSKRQSCFFFSVCLSFFPSFSPSLLSFCFFLSWFVWFNTIYSPKNYRGKSHTWTELLGKFFVMHYQYILSLLMIAHRKNTAATLELKSIILLQSVIGYVVDFSLLYTLQLVAKFSDVI